MDLRARNFDTETGQVPLTDMTTFQQALHSSKNIIAVAGAGLSAASGIPTFRGAGGLWRKFDAVSLATPEAFHDNPSRVWQFYHYRREVVKKARENAAHIALAKFSIQSIRDNLILSNPGSSFTLITQNIDGLSLRALEIVTNNDTDSPAESYYNKSNPSQPPVLEMHGRLFDVLCTKCPHVSHNTTSPICPALAGTEVNFEDPSTEILISDDELPRCESCGSLARPGVVWFGEIPHHMDEIDELIAKTDLCLVIGTSSTVSPAMDYAFEVQNYGGKVAVFNLERSAGDDEADFLFLGPCEETLPKALGLDA